jgi:hypothetical protein
LAAEIDRLNVILDGLSDGLNDAVSVTVQKAVTMAVQQAVQVALTEVLTSPAIIEQLREKIMPPAPVETLSPKDKTPRGGNCLCGWIGKQVKAVVAGCAASARAIGRAGIALVRKVTSLGRQGVVRGLELASIFGLLALRLARRYRLPLLVAAVVGTAIGLAAFGAGRLAAPLLCHLGAMLTTGAARVRLWLHRLLGREVTVPVPEVG